MKIKKINYSNVSILIASILTILSCTSRIDSKKNEDLKDVPSIIKESLDTSQSKVLFDTILIDVEDVMITISPRMNYHEGQSFKVIPLDLPLKSDTNYYGSYWIGVGESNLTKYKLLEQTIPLEWSKSGVSVPLGAYSLGKSVILPENSQSVNFMLGTEQEVFKVMNQNNGEIPMQLRISSFQKKFDLPKTEKEKLYLLIINQDPVNAYKINIKVIATQIIEKRE